MPTTQTLPKWIPHRPRYIAKEGLQLTRHDKVLAYLYMRQAPVSWSTLRIVAGVGRYDSDSFLTSALRKGLVRKVARSQYVIGQVPVKDAARLIAAVRYCPQRVGG